MTRTGYELLLTRARRLVPAVRLYRLLITKSRYVTFSLKVAFANHSTQVPASTLFYAPSARATGKRRPTLVNSLSGAREPFASFESERPATR